MGSGAHDISFARRLRTIFGSAEAKERLIWPERLGKSDLDKILQTFINCPYKKPIEHTINYLNINWKRESSIERKLMGAFTAFETIVNGIGEVEQSNLTVSSADFRKLRIVLKKKIKEFSTEHQWNKEVREEIYSKLCELQYRPIVPRALSLLKRYKVGGEDLWSDNVSLEEGLKQTYARRSQFIHRGQIDDYNEAMNDTDRIHTLTERLVYALLGGKREWLCWCGIKSSSGPILVH